LVNFHTYSARLAEEAGTLLLHWREAGDATEADALSHRQIVDGIAREYPDDRVLSEEGSARPSLTEPGRVWIIDPLDGTREYREGRTDWAVHVAAAEDGSLVAGAVALPARGMTLSTDAPPALPPSPPEVPRLVLSRTRRPARALAIADRIGAEIIEMGSAGAKTMAVVLGEADVYAHGGGINIWDVAAPAAVADAVGLHVSRVDGSPLRLGENGTYVPDFLVCHPELVSRVLEAAR